MRILYICSDRGIPADGTKGASVHLRAITRAISQLGHEVFLLSPSADTLVDHPATALSPTEPRTVRRLAKEMKHWLEGHELPGGVGREVRSILYNDVAVQHARAALSDRRPDAIIERLSLFGYAGAELADAYGVPLLVEVNAPLSAEAGAHRSLQMTNLALTMERRVLDRADAVLPVSGRLAELLMDDGVDPEKTVVVPNGVDPDWLQHATSADALRDQLGLTGKLVIGFVGSFKSWHGADTLIEAFGLLHAKNPNTRLLLVGTGPEEAALQNLTARMNLQESVRFTGATPHEQIPSYLAAMDVAVAPFRDSSAFYFSPIKLFEYMGAGRCVVATKLGQMEDIIQDGVNGLTCAPSDPGVLAVTIEKALRSDELRDRVGERARQDVLGRYTWSHTAKAVCEVIENMKKKRKHTPNPTVTGLVCDRAAAELSM